MNSEKDVYEKVSGDGGELLYCPAGAVKVGPAEAGRRSDDCVEASTVGRYSGNLTVVDRFPGPRRKR